MAYAFPSNTPKHRRVPPLRFGLPGDGKACHVQLLYCQKTAVNPPGRQGGETHEVLQNNPIMGGQS